MKKLLPIILILFFAGGTIGTVYADDISFEKKQEDSTGKKIAKKFSRGIINFFTGPVELVKQPLLEAEGADSLLGVPAGCLTGFITGFGWMLYRMGSGVFDLITLPAPINDYDSIINPEFVI